MSGWKPIERMVSEPIWVLKYTLYYLPDGGGWCEKDTPGAITMVDCHGWYENEADALRVMSHFPYPNSYRIEKVWKREVDPAVPPSPDLRRADGGAW